MNMDHLIGQRFSLISKSEIRYVGTLHQINPEEATIALEDVLSFGTEQRAVEKFVPRSQQKFEFIVFRGSDVKDIKVVEDEEPKQPTPPNVPNDPAILNSSRPGQQGPPPPPGPQDRRESPFPPPGYPQQFGYPPPYPPQFGRGYGPPPGQYPPGSGFGPYGPPPPGYFGHPNQGFPGQGQFQGPPPPQPIAPPGQRGGPPLPGQPQAPQQPSQPTPELPVDNKAAQQAPSSKSPAPPQPTAGKPASQAPPTAPTGPKAATQPKGKVAPAIPFTVNQKSFTPPVHDAPAAQLASVKPGQSKAEMDEATLKAKQAVQEALAKLPGNNAPKPAPVPNAAAIDALTQKVNELGTTNGTSRGRGAPRGGRGQRGSSSAQPNRKIEIPKSDYDFESANKKFNKEDLIKEAIASGSPVGEDGHAEDAPIEGIERKDSIPGSNKAYNKSSSFFDNISSEAKDREEHTDGRAFARQNRADEFKKNVDTFGQGNVDGGYRGRGRGGYRGRQYGGNRGYRGGYNRGYAGRGGRGGQGQAQADPQAPPTTTPQIPS